jgi:hypothetical protein
LQTTLSHEAEFQLKRESPLPKNENVNVKFMEVQEMNKAPKAMNRTTPDWKRRR